MSMKSGKEASDAQLAAELESCRSRIQELERSLAELRENERIGGESEERLRLIAENMMDIIVLVDRNGAYQYVSPSFETVLGYSPALRGRLGFELVHPDDMPAVQNAFMKSILHRSPEKVEYRYRHAKGDYVWLEAVGKPVLNDREELTGAVLCLRDVTERKKAEEALRESEERFRFLAENMADIVWTLDLNLNTTYVSPSIERILGFTPEERKQRPVEEMMTPDSLRRVMEVFLEESRREKKEACDPLRNVIIEVEYYHADGRMLWMENSVKALRDRTGAMIGVYGSSRDITSRRRAEEALRESESKYRELVEFIPVALFEADLNGRVTATNPAIREMFGYDTADLDRGVNGFEVFVSQDQERIRDRFRSVLGGETSGGAEYTGIRKDGSTFPFMTYTSPIMRGGVPVGVRGAVIELTERKRVEEALRESEERFRHLADLTTEGILIHSQGEILDFNKSFLRMFGYESHEVLGGNALNVVSPPLREPLLQKMQSDYEDPFELPAVRKDGTPVLVEVRGRRITYKGRQVRVATLYDITGRKRVEEERLRLENRLKRAEKMEAVGALAGGVAHDLNNVLGVLVGFSELMLMDLPEGSRLRRQAMNILQSSQRGAAIIQDLLTLTRRGVAVSEVVDLNRVVLDYLNTPECERLKFYHPHVKIRTHQGKDLLNIKGSPVHLGKTVMNLVSNAAEAISDHGTVTIRTENRYIDRPIRGYDDVKEGDYAVLTVSDDGEGISEEDLGKIFEPFYTKKVMGRSGTGLGLSVVWGTVKDHSGYIDVQSERGRGTSFTLYFPITTETRIDERKEAFRPSYMGHGESILVVDDVEGQREIAVSILTRLGYRVHAVSGGEEAVEYLKAHPVDLLVLDMIMDPAMDGYETYRRISEMRPGQKTVIVSGFSETERVKMAQELGAGAYVRKPYIVERIGMAVREELDKP